MKSYKKTKITLFQLLLLLGIVSFLAQPIFAQEDVNTLWNSAKTYLQQQKFLDALPVLEKIIASDPSDAQAQFYYGFCLVAKSKNTKDKEQARQLLIKARNAYLKAKQLGSTEKVLDTFIASIPEDGRVAGKFSKNEQAEDFMNEAEANFANGQLDKAIELYQKALALDPQIYEAALFSGDAFFKKGDSGKAEIWFQKAIAIDPNRETAYRYSASPLMQQGKYDEARDRYIEAYISEPFNRMATIGIGQWAEATKTNIGHPRIDIPASVGTSANGNTQITLGMGDDNGDGSFAWTAYGISRAVWQTGKDGKLSEKFAKAYPNEKVYRHSLAEELDALKTTAVTLKSRMKDKDNPVKNLNPQLATLIKLNDEGLLEPYILLVLADRGIYQDYMPYLSANRDKLRQYVLKYVIGAKG